MSLAACSGGGGGGTGGGSGTAGSGTAGSGGTGGGSGATGGGTATAGGRAGGSGATGGGTATAGGRAGGSGATGGGSSATGGGSSATGGGSGATGGGSGTGGGNQVGAGVSCANPIILTGYTTAAPTEAEIATAGQQIHYRLPVVAGDVIWLSTETPTPPPGVRIADTALTVFSTDGSQKLASIDDSFPRIYGTDTSLFYRAPTTGSICVRLEEWQTWAGETPDAGFPDETIDVYFIKMRVNPISSYLTLDREQVDGGSNDTATSAQDAGWVSVGARLSEIIGGLDGVNDVDVYHLPATPADGGAGTSAGLAVITGIPFGAPISSSSPAGTNSYGSTLRNYAFRITTMAGVTIGSYTPPANPDNAPEELDMVGDPSTEYLLWVERPAGVAQGANDFYHASYLYFSDDNSLEDPATDTANNTLATAAPFPLVQDPMNARFRFGDLIGKLNVSGADVDHFSFTHGGGNRVTLSCRAQRSGSGLRGTQFQFVTDSATVETETETNNVDILWGADGTKAPIITTDAGTMYLKVSGATQDSTNTSNFYRCRVTVLAPGADGGF
ncbi:MAG: hypothetical protein JNK82_44195 [Myxococcaceae bacterium]|nr:hypothetical protein [Myxococcaceae bacterium]